jgi:hypothetical protein
MGSPVETLRTRVDRPTKRANTPPRSRRPDASGHARDAHGAMVADKAPIPERRPPPQADHGLTLFLIFTASALFIVALVVLAGAVGQMWILAPIMVADFAVTAAVLIIVVKLLTDAG